MGADGAGGGVVSLLISIDPGLRASGCAMWRDGLLERAALVSSLSESAATCEAVLTMVREVAQWVDDVGWSSDLRVICEYPRTYGGRASRGDANDLIAVALVSGALVNEFSGATASRLVLPQEWKGSAPKSATEARAREDLSRDELARVKLPRGARAAENVWDAVGIGLWALRKLGRRWPRGRGT